MSIEAKGALRQQDFSQVPTSELQTKLDQLRDSYEVSRLSAVRHEIAQREMAAIAYVLSERGRAAGIEMIDISTADTEAELERAPLLAA